MLRLLAWSVAVVVNSVACVGCGVGIAYEVELSVFVAAADTGLHFAL